MILIAGVGWWFRNWRLFKHVPIFIHLGKKFVILNFLLLLSKYCIYVVIFLISVYASDISNSPSMNHIKLEILSSKCVFYLYIRDDHPLVHVFQKVGDSSSDIDGKCLNIYQVVYRTLGDGLLCL